MPRTCQLLLLAGALTLPVAAWADKKDGDKQRRDRYGWGDVYDRDYPRRTDTDKEWRKEQKELEKDRREARREYEKDRREAEREWLKDRREAEREYEKDRREAARDQRRDDVYRDRYPRRVPRFLIP